MSAKLTSPLIEEGWAQFRGIIDNLPQACAFYEVVPDPAGHEVDCRFLDANPAFENLTGFRREDLLGRTAAELLPDVAASLRDVCGRVASTGRPESFVHARTSPGEGWWSVFTYPTAPGRFVLVISDITARKRAEAELRESREKYQALIETTSDFIWETDARGRYTYCSPQVEKLWGMNPAVMIGRTPFDVMPTEKRSDGEKYFAEIVGSPRPFRGLQSTVRLPGGRLVHVETDGVPFFDAEGKLGGFRGISRDVTDRKRAEDALKDSEAKANALIKYAPTGIFEIDYRGPRFTTVNDAMCRILGYTRDELLALNPSEVLDEEGRILFADRIRRQLAGENIEEVVEYRVRKKDGEIISAILNVSVAPTDQDPHRVLVIAHDITQRKRMEEALRERGLELQRLTETLGLRVRERTGELALANEQLKADAAERLRLVAAVEQADEGVVIMDGDGRIRYANAAFGKRSGCDPGRLRSMTYAQLLKDPQEGEDLWSGIKGSIDRGEAWHGRLSRGGNGDALELEVTVSPIYDASRRLINYLAVERDVTAEVRLQAHLRRLQKVEALGTLAGGIAHDFNNILNPIFISIELALLDPSLDLAVRRHLEVGLKAAQRGRDLVRQVIAFSRQKERKKEPTKAGPVVREAVNFLRATLPSTIEIRADIQDEACCVLGDQAQLHQVVMNLSNNAAHAMRQNGGVLSISLKAVDADAELAAQVPGLKPGRYFLLTVGDTGMGISPDVRERLFDPFFTTKAPGEGSGMGLPVVDGIVRDHGGAIAVESEVGRGSTFKVYLPRIAEEEARSEAVPESLPRGSARILLIDDEEVQVYSVRSMLEKFGYEVVPFTDGREALARFRSDPQAFDLVVTDQTMPHITGMQIAEELIRTRPDVPIILCTGFSETVDAGMARTLGIREFVMKPYSIREMAEAVSRALSKPSVT